MLNELTGSCTGTASSEESSELSVRSFTSLCLDLEPDLIDETFDDAEGFETLFLLLVLGKFCKNEKNKTMVNLI